MTPAGLPHSGTRGSTPADGSPRLFAAFRALLRLSTPRHPPCAHHSSDPCSHTRPSRQDRLMLHYSSAVNEHDHPTDNTAASLSSNARPHEPAPDHEPLPPTTPTTPTKNGPTPAGPYAPLALLLPDLAIDIHFFDERLRNRSSMLQRCASLPTRWVSITTPNFATQDAAVLRT